MKKRDLIFLHGLLDEVRRFLDEGEGLPDEAFADYEALGVGPASIHRTKDEHREAVMRLGRALAAAGEVRRGADGGDEVSPDA